MLRIINRFNLGGPTYNAAYLTRYLAPEFETMLIGGSPLPDEAHSGFILNELGVQYTEIAEMSRSINPLNDLMAFFKIRKIIKEFRPDIVHTHAAKAGALGRLAAALCGVPVIVHTYHGHVFSGYFSHWKTLFVKMIERWLAKKSSAIITISKMQFSQIVEEHGICDTQRGHIIPLGFDLSRFQIGQPEKRLAFRNRYFVKENEVAIGIIGRFAPVKNHKLFFDSLTILETRTNAFKAFVIGDGEAKQELLQYSSHLRSSQSDFENSKVIFTSWIKNIDEALAGLDIVVLTSVNEGTPVSLIEAQAASRPVVSTDVGGVRDCILPNKSGLLVADFEPASMAEALLELVNNESRRDEMGALGKAFVNEQYSYQRLVLDVRNLYQNLLLKHNK